MTIRISTTIYWEVGTLLQPEHGGLSPRHPSILGTLPLSKSSVSPNPPCSVQFSGSRPRVHGDGFADNKAITDEFSDGLAGVGIGDLVDFIGVQPDLALAASDD